MKAGDFLIDTQNEDVLQIVRAGYDRNLGGNIVTVKVIMTRDGLVGYRYSIWWPNLEEESEVYKLL